MKKLNQEIHNWLEKQGYPTEMRVAEVFRKEGFSCVNADFYWDPEGENYREIDVVASLSQKSGADTVIRIHFFIECKLSPGKPWLLFTSPRTLGEKAAVAQRMGSTIGRKALNRLARIPAVRELPLFKLEERPAYGVTRALANGKDVPYSAAMGVSKAAAAEAEKDKKESGDRFRICSIIFPIIVVDGDLFECYLDDASKVALSRISKGTLLWRNPVAKLPHTIIQIVTLTGLTDFLNDTKGSLDNLIPLLKQELQDQRSPWGNF